MSLSRRRFLPAAAAALASSQIVSNAAGARSRKKGWAGGKADYHKKFGARWYYNWTPGIGSSDREFVPMIKGSFNVNEKTFARIRKYEGITHLLGFNEPERAKQGNTPIPEAIKLWPKLIQLAKSKNLKLGTPAPSSDRGGMAYFHEFMDEIRRKKLRVDFIAMHWYRGRNADEFENFVTDLGRRYRLPVWITEFNGWSGSEAEHYRFLKDSLRFLERSRHVERYAYFNPPAGKPHSLLASDGSLTRMGEMYREAGN